MSPSRLTGPCLWMLVLLPVSIALAFDAYDSYDSPDPGSYWQGSAPAPAHSSGYGAEVGRDAARPTGENQASDWYTSDWFQDQAGGGRWDSWRVHDPGSYPPRTSYPPMGTQPPGSDGSPEQAARGYGYPDDAWRRDDDSGHAVAPEGPYGRPSYPSGGYRGSLDDGNPGDRADEWHHSAGAPRYRFRNDPRFDDANDLGVQSGYRFRPLTAKEVQRHRESLGPGTDRPAPRVRQPDNLHRSGEAFGYEPDDTADDFFRRFYRGGR